ncbi:unnamed protein product [Adineta steineri]|nr:unnamed protein product [Adineta steineri]
MLFTLTTFGAIFDNRKYALRLERIRLVLMLLLSQPLILKKSFFLFQAHFNIQILLLLSFISTFCFQPSGKLI